MDRSQIANLFSLAYMNQRLTSVYFALVYNCCAKKTRYKSTTYAAAWIPVGAAAK